MARKQASEANANRESRAYFVEEYMPVPMVMFDARGLIRRVNPAAEQLFGIDERELYGQTLLRLMPKSPEAHSGETQVRRRDGTLLPVRFRVARADNGGREIYLFFEKPEIARPEAARTAAPSVLIVDEARSSLAVVEGVVSRIVRQFEGLLTTINGYTELAMHGADPDSPILSDLKELAAASDTASNLARNLLAFSGNQTIPAYLMDLNVLVGAMEPAIREAVRGSVQIQGGTERAAVMGNADALRQVVSLLVRSAHHRAAGKGTIRIASNRQHLAEGKAVYTGRIPAGEYGMLTVSDTGAALAAATLEHLFEPLFLDAEAVGVELAPVYGIVRSLGGWIDVTYESENGNTFDVYFPYAGDVQVGSASQSGRALVN